MNEISNGQSAGKQIKFKEFEIDGFGENYLVTNEGKIWSKYLNDYLKTFFSKGGYIRCRLAKGERGKKFMVHRLVALAFVPNPENKPFVNHKNHNRADNTPENLEWCTQSENMQHATLAGNKDTRLYILTNDELGKKYEFTRASEIAKVFKGICLRYLREIANTGKVPMKGALKGWVVEKFDLKLQRPELECS
jgi:hypothetical protein